MNVYQYFQELRKKRAREEEERWREEEEQRKAEASQYEKDLEALQEKAVRFVLYVLQIKILYQKFLGGVLTKKKKKEIRLKL